MSTGSDWSWPTVHGGEKTNEDSSNDDMAGDTNKDNMTKTDAGGGLGLVVAEDRSRRISKLPPAEV